MHPSFPACKITFLVIRILILQLASSITCPLTDISTTTGSQFNLRFIHGIEVLPEKFQRRQWQPQYSCLENPMDRGALWAAVHGVPRSRTRLSDFTFTFHLHALKKEMATHPVFLPGGSQDGGAWWTAAYGVTQSQTRLKWLSSKKGFKQGRELIIYHANKDQPS